MSDYEFDGNTGKQLSAEQIENLPLVKQLIAGEAPEDHAYKLGMQLIGLAVEPLNKLELSKVSEMAREEIEVILDGVSSGKSDLKAALPLFEHYPAVKKSVKGTWEAIFYAESLLIPLLVTGSKQSHESSRRPCTYLLKNPQSGLIKIGRSVDLETRIQALSCGAGMPLEVLAVISSDIEKELHDKFQRFRIYGEWFEDTEGLIAAYAEEHREQS